MFQRTAKQQLRGFQTFAARNVKAGDKIPSVQLFEGSPSDAVDISKEVAHGKNLIVTVPGAYSTGCSSRHVPGYRDLFPKFEDKGIQKVFIVSVNDAFVTKAWSETFGETNGLRFLADPSGILAKKLKLDFDASKFFGNDRFKRAAILVEDGVVKDAAIEPDSTGITISEADKVLDTL